MLRHTIAGLIAVVSLGSAPSFVAAVTPYASGPPVCGTPPPPGLPPLTVSSQFISVLAPSFTSTHAQLRTYHLINGCWVASLHAVAARLGVNGLSANRREGDGTTPIGVFSIGSTMYGNAPNPGVHYPYVRLRCGSWWDEDSRSPRYNLFVQLHCGQRPPFNGARSEALWTEVAPYPSFAVIDFNEHRVPGLGSGIFLHADTGSPTASCIALPLTDLDQVLAWLQPQDHPIIAIAVAAPSGTGTP